MLRYHKKTRQNHGGSNSHRPYKLPERPSKHLPDPERVPRSYHHEDGRSSFTSSQQLFWAVVALSMVIEVVTVLPRASRSSNEKQPKRNFKKNSESSYSSMLKGHFNNTCLPNEAPINPTTQPISPLLTPVLNLLNYTCSRDERPIVLNPTDSSNKESIPLIEPDPISPPVTPPDNSLIACDSTDYCVALGLQHVPYNGETCFWQHRGCDIIKGFISKDGKKTWKQTVDEILIPGSCDYYQLNDIVCAPATPSDLKMQNCVVGGQIYTSSSRDIDFRALILSTQNAGLDWHLAAGGITCCFPFNPWSAKFVSVASATQGKFVAAGKCAPHQEGPNYMYYIPLTLISSDGGASWQWSAKQARNEKILIGSSHVKGVKCEPDTNKCLLTGETYIQRDCSSFLFFSNDAGNHWTEVNESESEKLMKEDQPPSISNRLG